MSTQPALTAQPAAPRAAADVPAWHHLSQANRPLVLTVAVSLALLAIAALGLVLDPRTITGVPAWMKPLKFAISVAVYSGSLAWLLRFVQGRQRLVALATGVISLSLIAELVIIAVQVLRGTTSHYNLSTPLDGALFSAMGLLIMLVWVMNLVVAVLLMRAGPRAEAVEPALVWSLRLGLLLSGVGMAVGFIMTSTPSPAQAAALAAGQPLTHYGAHSVGVEDGGPGLPLLGWSTTGGDLRVAHFIGLHALQVLPLLAFGLRRARLLGAAQRLGLVWTGALGYLGLIALTTWQALRGQPLIAPDALTLAAAASLAGLVTLAALAIVAARRR